MTTTALQLPQLDLSHLQDALQVINKFGPILNHLAPDIAAKLPVPTTLPAGASIQAHIASISFADMERALETAGRFAPYITMFYPPAAPFLAALPVAENALLMLDDIKTHWGNGPAIVDAISTRLHGMADAMQATKPHIISAIALPSPKPLPPGVTAAEQQQNDFQAPTGAT